MKHKSKKSPTFQNIIKNNDKNYSSNRPYITPTPGEIPVIVNTPVPKGTHIENADFDLIHNWCANAAIAGPLPGGIERVKQLLECAKNSGIKIILSGTSYPYESYYKIAKEINTNPLIGGYLIKDEPTFEEWKDYISTRLNNESLPPENIYELYQVMRKDFTQHMSFFNLAADPTQKKFMGDFETYEEFLEGFQNVFAPPVWMFDYYLARINLKNNPENTVIDYRYYYFYDFLLKFQSISKKTRRPFWAYCQCISEEIKDSWKFPTPTTDLVRFEAFTALAFGAKGIAYYRYAEWKENRPDYVFYTCPVIRDNIRPGVKIKTMTWDVIKKVNEEIKAYSRVFLNTELINVFSSWFKEKRPDQKPGEDFSLDEVPLIELPYGPLVKVESNLYTNRRGVMISHLKFGVKNYLVFISRSAQDAQIITTQFKYNRELRFVGMGGVKEVNKPLSSNSVMTGEYKWDMNPGGYFIVEWDESN